MSAALVGGALYAAARTQSKASLESVALAAEASSGIEMKTVAEGFDGGLTDVQFVPGAGLRAVILEKEGTARVLTLPGANEKRVVEAKSGSLLVDVKVRSQSELGLLGLAFHPDFAKNGLFYLNYNPAEGALRTRIAEWHVPPERVASAPASERRVVLEVPQPYKNHNGGQLVFGPDRMLYIGLGDGGGGDDPERNGQNLGSLLGKMLRIDVNGRQANKGYAVPPDNPFVGRQGARPEIWAYGLRNPWRFSFDPKGRLIAADVGQDAWEEVDIVERGPNLGWNVREGRHCLSSSADCPAVGVPPIFEYDRSQGISITGGYVYTGKAIPSLRGQYLFGDFATARLWALELPDKPRAVPARIVGKAPSGLSTFGRAPDGELYLGALGGTLYRMVPKR